MYVKLKLVFRLFYKPFVFVGVLYFIALVLFLSVVSLKNSYEMGLEDEFATKQPHIKISLINDTLLLSPQEIAKEKAKICSLSPKIATVSEYLKGDAFFTSQGTKTSGGDANFQGDIEVIGLGDKKFVYDFYDASFASREPFNIAYTPLEFIYALQSKKNSVLFNATLFHSYFPVIASIENFTFTNKDVQLKAKFTATFNDYDKKSILYTNVNFANRLLNHPSNKIDGFYVNAKHLEDINSLTKELQEKLLPSKYIVKSWLQERQKQYMMFSIFELLSFVIVSVVLLLSLLFILLLLYNAIVKKSYQLSVLLTIGFKLQKEIFGFVLSVMLLDTFALLLYVQLFLEKITNSFGLVYTKHFFMQASLYLLFIDIFFALVSYLLIESAYKMKAKSVF